MSEEKFRMQMQIFHSTVEHEQKKYKIEIPKEFLASRGMQREVVVIDTPFPFLVICGENDIVNMSRVDEVLAILTTLARCHRDCKTYEQILDSIKIPEWEVKTE